MTENAIAPEIAGEGTLWGAATAIALFFARRGMTRQTPDHLVEGSSSYSLYAYPSILPSGDPRWAKCRFARGRTTANYRGYGATWQIEGGQPFLQSFGGAVETLDPERRCIQIGMPDVHEVDGPVPATWVSGNLHGASAEHLGGLFSLHSQVFSFISHRSWSRCI